MREGEREKEVGEGEEREGGETIRGTVRRREGEKTKAGKKEGEGR